MIAAYAAISAKPSISPTPMPPRVSISQARKFDERNRYRSQFLTGSN
ncbi:MAG: hypothetical protein HT580_10705 [Dechloromonas sp.]|nr:MAG: hypothetical protein HT580_10705 [Dechloromonas sp.]